MEVIFENKPYFIRDKNIILASGVMHIFSSGNMVTVPLEKTMCLYDTTDAFPADYLYAKETAKNRIIWDKQFIEKYNVYAEIKRDVYELHNTFGGIVLYADAPKTITVDIPPGFETFYHIIYDPTYNGYGININLKLYKDFSHIIVIKAVVSNFERILLSGYKLEFDTTKGRLYKKTVETNKFGEAYNLIYLENLEDTPEITVKIHE